MKPLLVIAAAACPPLPAHAIVYYSTAIEGRVVDAESGRPVQGALVTANWQLEGGFDTGVPRAQLKILETTTDASGAFRLPSWGPRLSFAGHPSSKWPQILIFKPGFKYRRQFDRSPDGVKIALSPIQDLEAYAKEFGAFNREIDWIGVRSGNQCAWRELPATLRMLAEEGGRLQSLGVRGFSWLIAELRAGEDYFQKQGCGSVKEFLSGDRK